MGEYTGAGPFAAGRLYLKNIGLASAFQRMEVDPASHAFAKRALVFFNPEFHAAHMPDGELAGL